MTTHACAIGAAGRGWAAEAVSTLRLSGPLILTNLAQVAIMTTDVAMLGWLSPRALAASTLGVNVFFPLMVMGMGIGMACAPMMAQAIGRRRGVVRDVRRTVRQGLWLCVLFTLPSWLIVWHADALLGALGQEADLAADAGVYVRAMMWGLPFTLGFVVLRSFVSALERPAAALWVTAGAVLFNAACDWALIFGHWGMPALGLTGAGVASALTAGLQFLAIAAFVLWSRRFRRFHLFGRWWRADGARAWELTRLSVPIGGAFLFEVGVINAIAFMMGLFGAAALAAHAIGMQIASVTWMVPFGLAQAATVRVGLAAGAGDAIGVTRAGWIALALAAAFMGAMALVMLAAPLDLVRLFLDLTDPETAPVLPLAVKLLAAAAVFQVADGVQAVASGALRGLKDARIHLIATGIGYWGLALPLAAGLGIALERGPLGLWTGLAVGVIAVAALLTWRWTRRDRLGLVPRG